MDGIAILEVLGAAFGVSQAMAQYPNLFGCITAAGFAVVCVILASKALKRKNIP